AFSEDCDMAKRTPRSEADDTTAAADPTRQPRTSTTGGRAEPADARPTGGAGRSRPGREGDDATRGAAPEAADTFAARPQSANQSDEGRGEPTEDEIRFRAYELYVERGGEHGLDFEDWMRAEQELKTRSR